MKERDVKIAQLQSIIDSKKEAIQKIGKKNWQTNCSFSWNGKNVNIQTANLETVVAMVGDLVLMKDSHDKALQLLSLSNKGFTCNNYSFGEWLSDFQERVIRLNLENEKSKLTTLEKKLSSLLSEDAKADKELSEISDLLK